MRTTLLRHARGRGRASNVLLLALLAACGTIGAPKSLQGDIPVTIYNHTQYELCEFRMGPPDAIGENWVTDKLQPDISRGVKVRSGNYQVTVQGCEGAFSGALQSVTIDGPTKLVIGRPVSPSATLRIVQIPTTMTANNCVGVGGAPLNGQSCCSGRTHYDNVNHETLCD
jgi:hypothetical protein